MLLTTAAVVLVIVICSRSGVRPLTGTVLAMDAPRKRQLTVGVVAIIGGILVEALKSPRSGFPLRGLPAGLFGGGGSLLFTAWIGKDGPERRARVVARVVLAALVLLAAGFVLLKLITTKHSTARLIGDGVLALATIGAAVVVTRVLRRA